MMPAVHVPETAAIGTPIEVKLKSRYRYDAGKQTFVPASGKDFHPLGELPKGSRIVSKAAGLEKKSEASMSKWEKELSRHLQVILPPQLSPRDFIDAIRKWPGVEEAWLGPEISLPGVK